MLIELLSTKNNAYYNIKIAQTFGLYTAVYLSALIDMYQEAIDKEKLIDGFCSINRAEITRRTDLTAEEQCGLDEVLTNLSLITIQQDGKKSRVKLDIDKIAGIISNLSEDKLKDLKKRANQAISDAKMNISLAPKGTTKLQNAIEASYRQIDITQPPEFQDAMKQWINTIAAKLHYITPQQTTLAQKDVLEFARNDAHVAVEVLNIAITGGLQDITWAEERYIKKYNQIKNNIANMNHYNPIPVTVSNSNENYSPFTGGEF